MGAFVLSNQLVVIDATTILMCAVDNIDHTEQNGDPVFVASGRAASKDLYDGKVFEILDHPLSS
jgi:hypothetical protein